MKTHLLTLLLTVLMAASGYLAGCGAVRAGQSAFTRALPGQTKGTDIPGAVDAARGGAEDAAKHDGRDSPDWTEYLGGALGAAAAAGLGLFVRRKEVQATGALKVLVPAVDMFRDVNPTAHETLLNTIRDLRPEGKDRVGFETVIDRARP